MGSTVYRPYLRRKENETFAFLFFTLTTKVALSTQLVKANVGPPRV